MLAPASATKPIHAVQGQLRTDIATFGHGTPTVTPIPPTHPFFRKDLLGRFTFGNRRFCEAVGKPLRDIIGKRDDAFFPAELGFSTPSSFSFAFRRATGGTPASFREQLHRAASRTQRLKAH